MCFKIYQGGTLIFYCLLVCFWVLKNLDGRSRVIRKWKHRLYSRLQTICEMTRNSCEKLKTCETRESLFTLFHKIDFSEFLVAGAVSCTNTKKFFRDTTMKSLLHEKIVQIARRKKSSRAYFFLAKQPRKFRVISQVVCSRLISGLGWCLD